MFCLSASQRSPEQSHSVCKALWKNERSRATAGQSAEAFKIQHIDFVTGSRGCKF